MALVIPADPECKECDGKGQKIEADGYTVACRTCTEKLMRRPQEQHNVSTARYNRVLVIGGIEVD